MSNNSFFYNIYIYDTKVCCGTILPKSRGIIMANSTTGLFIVTTGGWFSCRIRRSTWHNQYSVYLIFFSTNWYQFTAKWHRFIIKTWLVYMIQPSIFREINIPIKIPVYKNQPPVVTVKRPVVTELYIILNRGSMFAFQWREFSPPLSSFHRLLHCYHRQKRDRRRCNNSRGIPPQQPATRAISQWARNLEWRHAVTLHILVGKICISVFLFYCEGMLSLVVLWLCACSRVRHGYPPHIIIAVVYIFIVFFLLFWLWKLPEFYFLAQAFANLHGKRRQGKFIWKTRIYMLQTCKHDTAKLIFQKVLIF